MTATRSLRIDENLAATARGFLDSGTIQHFPDLLRGVVNFCNLSQVNANAYVDLVAERFRRVGEAGEVLRIAALIDRAARPIFERADPRVVQRLSEMLRPHTVLWNAFEQCRKKESPRVELNPAFLAEALGDPNPFAAVALLTFKSDEAFLRALECAHQGRRPAYSQVIRGLMTGSKAAGWLIPYLDLEGDPNRSLDLRLIYGHLRVGMSPLLPTFFAKMKEMGEVSSLSGSDLLGFCNQLSSLENQVLIYEVFKSGLFDGVEKSIQDQMLARLEIPIQERGKAVTYLPLVRQRLEAVRKESEQKVWRAAYVALGAVALALCVSPFFFLVVGSALVYGLISKGKTLKRKAEFLTRLDMNRGDKVQAGYGTAPASLAT